MKYSTTNCNIKGCTGKHFQILLCKKHFKEYIINEKVKKIQTNVYEDNFGKFSLKNKIRLWFFRFLHYYFSTRVYYVEHFPLESLFMYYYQNPKQINKEKVTSFIADFDYEVNINVAHVKSVYETPDANNHLKEFSAKTNSSQTKVYIILYLIGAIVYILSRFIYKLQIPHMDKFDTFMIVGLVSLPIVYLGSAFTQSFRQILDSAIENNLYLKHEENSRFLRRSRALINAFNRNQERHYSLIGMLSGVNMIFIVAYIQKNLKFPFINLLCGSVIFLILSTLTIILFTILWRNLFILPVTHRFHDEPFKFNLYALDKNLGIERIKNFIRTLIYYDTIVIFTMFYLSITGLVEKWSLIHFILAVLISWNISSVYFAFRLRAMLGSQFQQNVKVEKEALEKTDSSDRFHKHDFIEKLDLNIFFKWETLKKVALSSIPFILKMIFENYGKTILDFVKPFIN